jgi:SAM-dependent methyltransferase
MAMQIKCNICNRVTFGPGPGGRLFRGHIPPRCLGCRSLERHRALHEIYKRLGKQFFKRFPRALQFSKDPVVPADFFKSYHYSIYGGHNSLDITAINLPNSSFDWIICNHVLEHIEDDRKAVAELLRITRRGGVVQINVPGPVALEYTNEWGYPDPNNHEHFREYGRLDFIPRYSDVCGREGCTAACTECKDPVTGARDFAYFFSSCTATLSSIEQAVS